MHLYDPLWPQAERVFLCPDHPPDVAELSNNLQGDS